MHILCDNYLGLLHLIIHLVHLDIIIITILINDLINSKTKIDDYTIIIIYDLTLNKCDLK